MHSDIYTSGPNWPAPKNAAHARLFWFAFLASILSMRLGHVFGVVLNMLFRCQKSFKSMSTRTDPSEPRLSRTSPASSRTRRRSSAMLPLCHACCRLAPNPQAFAATAACSAKGSAIRLIGRWRRDQLRCMPESALTLETQPAAV